MRLRSIYTAILLGSCALVALFFFNSATSEQEAETTHDDQYRKYFNENYKIFSLDVPEEFSFAGEPMPLHVPDVKERFDRELLVNTYWQSQALVLFKRSNRWFPVIEPILAEEGIPDDFKFLAVAESGLSNVVSPAKAAGFWQFLKGTAKQYGLEVNDDVDERYNVELATRAACKYLRSSYERYGTWTLAAAAYNYGEGNVNKQLARQGVSDYYDLLLNEETARYVFRMSAIKEILSHPARYGFHFRPGDLYEPYNSVIVEVDTPIVNMADFAKSFDMNYKGLKTLNPWLRDDHLDNKSRKTYRIRIAQEGDKSYSNAEQQ